MRTDYKLSRVVRDRDGRIVSVVARVYEGDVTTADEQGVPVTRYRRTAKLRDVTLGPTILKGTTDVATVRAVLGLELARDATRQPIEAQAVTLDDVARVDALEATVVAADQ